MGDKIRYRPLDKKRVVPILNKISIFGGLSDEQLTRIFKLLEGISYKAGEVIFRQGDEASHIYIILSGTVKIVVGADYEPLELVSFSTGQCFGETSVIGIQPHSATAIAVTDTELMVLERRDLLSIFESDKELFGLLILNIAREACRRLHKSDEVLLHYIYHK
ncbi:MAG: cyclic nucleotide-binding domain-containing protein [Candidatus Omnitrophica bacterium]|nr:cyclic nucleotide-binding domain-containing protein [Candidatus Omnitrophota bacterium]